MVAVGFQIGAEVPHVPVWMRFQPPPSLMPKRIWVNEFLMRKVLEAFGMKAAFATGEISRSDEMLKWMVALMNNTAMSWNEMVGAPFPIDDPTTYHSSDLLQQITAPTLFVWGEDDPWAGEASARKLMEAMAAPTSLLMLPDAGHAPWLDALDDVANAIRTHLNA